MKLMRSRIRIISLILTCAFFAVILWSAHTILVLSEPSRETPAQTTVLEVSVESPSSPVLITEPPETPSPASGELYDTFGL